MQTARPRLRDQLSLSVPERDHQADLQRGKTNTPPLQSGTTGVFLNTFLLLSLLFPP